jgi:hypothetical protein
MSLSPMPWIGQAHRYWDLKAAMDVFKADKDGDIKLNREEFKAISTIQGDTYLANAARNYEFDTIDEIKVADNLISMEELSGFYKRMDSNGNSKHTHAEFQAALNQSSFRTKIVNPVASFSNVFTHYSKLVTDYIAPGK